MKIVKAEQKDAQIVGLVHSMAWRQAYKNTFPQEYLVTDTAENRTKEFLESNNNGNISYYLIYAEELAVGVVKVVSDSYSCEISSIYILEEYRSKGYGRAAIAFIKGAYAGQNVYLWVLEENTNARRFYEKNGFKDTEIARKIWRGKDFLQCRYELSPEI